VSDRNTDVLTVTMRVRLSQRDAHYGGDLVDGARVLRLFGDIITEIAVRTDGDEGLLTGYSSIEFTGPVYAGDIVEAVGTLIHRTRLRRTVEFEARKVIAARYDLGPSAARVLDEPIVVCRAVGTSVVPSTLGRRGNGLLPPPEWSTAAGTAFAARADEPR
jgi:3-aminobutyryl-CoA ammonia-lyase